MTDVRESDPREEQPDHVVVFVHGMGKALKGGTLQEWSQPLMQSLYDLSIDRAGKDTDAAPLIIDTAHAIGESPEVRVKVLKESRNGSPVYVDVLMTEASWASDFKPATPASTYWWAFLTAGRVFQRSMELLWWSLYPTTANSRIQWWIRKIIQVCVCVAVAIPASALLVVALVVLALMVIFAQLPGGRLWIGKLVALFADFLGDPEVWKRKPLQAAAMRQRVKDTLRRWDPNKGTQVHVVAHSQGAAICGQLLFQNEDQAHATNFVTVGSGLSLLGYAQWGGRSEDPVADWLQNAPHIRWINVWGKFDFVPAGPIGSKTTGDSPVFRKIYDRGSPGNGNRGPEEHPVYNRSGVIYDHIVYSKNRVEVIDPIAQLILSPESTGSLAFKTIVRDPRLKPHRVMVKCLGVTRLLAIMTAAMSAPSILTMLNMWGPVRRLLQCDPDEINHPWWSSQLCSASTYRWDSWAQVPTLVIVSLLVAALLIYLLNGLLWGLLHSKLERRRVSPRKARHTLPKTVEQRFGRNPGSPWWWLAWYLAISLGLAVVTPLAIIRPGTGWIAAFTTAVCLWALCFFGTGIRPLAARTTDTA